MKSKGYLMSDSVSKITKVMKDNKCKGSEI